MIPLVGVSGDVLFAAYVLVFVVAAVACTGSLSRARLVEDRDTRRGLTALLLTGGGWAAAHVGYLLAPTPELKLACYYVGLVVGIGAVGPWLYFCSAYSGRTLHRAPPLRRLAVGVFLGIVAVKLTNPLHGFYFRAEYVTTPFPHLAVHNQPLHWLTMALAYALATVGYFMLLELFWEVGYDTNYLLALVGVTGLPVLLDVVALLSPLLLDITYEPLGVAVFAVGVLFVYLEEFRTIRFAGDHDDPVIVLDDADRVRDYNTEAEELFPTLDVGRRVVAVLPEFESHVDADEAVVEVDRTGETRYYRLSVNPFTTGTTGLGRTITLADITEREQYRSELERQNERLSQFASVVSHDLRNPLGVAMGRVELARQEHDSEHLGAARTALARMESLVDDLLTLAREGQPIDETERVRLSTVVERCWDVVDSKDATLSVDTDIAFVADPNRLEQLLENLLRNAIEHGGEDVTVRVGALAEANGFYVEDDGPGMSDEIRRRAFESGYSTETGGTGFGLAIVREIVEAHGWDISATDSEDGGARFEITGVESPDG